MLGGLVTTAAAGCHHRGSSHVAGGALGRVVIYRNGVAFYERTAVVADGRLTVHVPRGKVDDFLKSLTVVDRRTGQRMSVSIPRQEAADDSYLTMTLETADRGRADVLVTYVTEAPAWKPSYRVIVGTGGKVMLEGWAVVDNTTTEDWKRVLVGVGASSALAFRYDLWSVRHVDRDLLAGEDRFAIAPPQGVSPYAEAGPTEELASLDGAEVRRGADQRGEVIQISERAPTIDPARTTSGVTISRDLVKNVPVPGRTFESTLGAAAGSQGESFSGSSSLEHQYVVDGINTTGIAYGRSSEAPPPPVLQGDAKLKASVARILEARKDVIVEVHGAPGTEPLATARGQAVKNKLVVDGVPASRIRIALALGAGEADRVRVLAVAPGARPTAASPPESIDHGSDAPVGESHFFAEHPMTVRAGSSAMVAMVHAETTGGVVYLYDPLSARGDQRFAFKAVRLDNPTKDTLEPGPVTVYGDGRFIGEGITEPVPPRASVVVPFALDKQVVVTRTGAEQDHLARLLTVERGIATAEIQHRRTTTFEVTSRLTEPTTVYLRHRLEAGWTLIDAPSTFTRVGDSQLFELALAAGETRILRIAEATPVERRLDLGASDTLGMMKLYVDDPAAAPAIKAQLVAVLATHRGAADLGDRIATLRDQLAEYRTRSGELHAQIVTLKLVKSGGELLAALRQKQGDIATRIQRATIELVDTQEKLMLARVRFQDQLAELQLDDATTPQTSRR